MLCDLFTEVLSVPQIGIDDGFFDLGGHSPCTAYEPHERGAWSGTNIGTLFAAPTVAGLAERLEMGNGQSALDVASITSKRGSLPLFCVHPAGGLLVLWDL